MRYLLWSIAVAIYLFLLIGCDTDDCDTGKMELFAIEYANGASVTVGHDYLIGNSADSEEFYKQYKKSDGSLRTVCFGNGIWLTAGTNGVILTSTDTANWFAQSLDTTRTLYGSA